MFRQRVHLDFKKTQTNNYRGALAERMISRPQFDFLGKVGMIVKLVLQGSW